MKTYYFFTRSGAISKIKVEDHEDMDVAKERYMRLHRLEGYGHFDKIPPAVRPHKIKRYR